MAGTHGGDNSDVAAIEQLRTTHVQALNSGDVDAWVGLFAEDGVQMPPNLLANVGVEKIRSWSAAFLNLFRVRFALAVDEVRVSGDWAFERGGYTISLTPKAGGEPLQDTGKYITVYERRADGAWKIARDIWNSDNPMPGTG